MSFELFMQLRCIPVIMLFSTAVIQVKAQESKVSTPGTPSSRLKMGISYLSNDVYNGRKDSLAVPYLTPKLTYQHKSGLYADARLSFLMSSYATRLDMTTLSAGYRHYVTDDLYLSGGFSKYFFNSASVSVRSAIKGDVNLGFSYDLGTLFSIDGGADLVLNTGPSDIFLNLGLSKDIDLDSEGTWNLSPAIMTIMGTRNYHEQYLKTRSTKKTSRKNGTTNTGSIKVVRDYTTIDAGKIVPLDLELAVPFYYMSGPWTFNLTPTYAIPFSPATYKVITTRSVTINGSTTTTTRESFQQESISPSFFVQVGLTYKFGVAAKHQ